MKKFVFAYLLTSTALHAQICNLVTLFKCDTSETIFPRHTHIGQAVLANYHNISMKVLSSAPRGFTATATIEESDNGDLSKNHPGYAVLYKSSDHLYLDHKVDKLKFPTLEVVLTSGTFSDYQNGLPVEFEVLKSSKYIKYVKSQHEKNLKRAFQKAKTTSQIPLWLFADVNVEIGKITGSANADKITIKEEKTFLHATSYFATNLFEKIQVLSGLKKVSRQVQPLSLSDVFGNNDTLPFAAIVADDEVSTSAEATSESMSKNL